MGSTKVKAAAADTKAIKAKHAAVKKEKVRRADRRLSSLALVAAALPSVPRALTSIPPHLPTQHPDDRLSRPPRSARASLPRRRRR